MKKHLKWPKELEVGLKEIDSQHKKLYKFVNKLLSDCLDCNSCNCVKAKFDLLEIYDFAKKHFSTEERIMRDYDYPEYGEHCEKHKEILNSLKGIKTKIDEGESSTKVYSEFSCKVVDWFSRQTMEEDLKLAKFLQKNVEKPKTLKGKLKKYFPN